MANGIAEPQGADEDLATAMRRLLDMQPQPRSLRWLAKEVRRPVSFLSRAVREVDGKAASVTLLSEIAAALDVPAEWFAAVREARVIEAIRSDPQLRERLFKELGRNPPGHR